ncbi:MAG: DUF3598 family protein [Microcoleaceae cyanobacterium]
MGSQWDNFLQNLGEWQGSFTQISPQGEIVKDTPSVLILEQLEDNKTVRLTLRRFPPSPDGITKPPVDELVREYQSFGRDLLFFENGAFSQGPLQLSPTSPSGAEFGFIGDNRRLRVVELCNPEGNLQSFTLIREYRAGTEKIERPPLTVEMLLGTWHGVATILYPDLRPSDTFKTQMQLQLDGSGRLQQQLSFGNQTISSSAKIEDSVLYFDESSQPIKVFLLPDGASATVPQKVQMRTPIFFEAGWLISPTQRQRLIRRYNEKGEFESLTFVQEEKIN